MPAKAACDLRLAAPLLRHDLGFAHTRLTKPSKMLSERCVSHYGRFAALRAR